MGKTLKIAGALLLICAVTFTAATTLLMPISDDVTVTQTTLHGDSSAAAGLQIDFRTQYKSTLHWDIHCDPITGESDTDFFFSHDDPFYKPRDNGLKGVEMYPILDPRTFSISLEGQLSAPEDSGITRLIAHLNSLPVLKNQQNGNTAISISEDENTHIIDLSDFFEYYPFGGMIDISNVGYMLSWEAHSEYIYNATESSKMFSKLFNDYFKIPVRNKALVEVNIFEYRDGRRGFHFGGFPDGSTYFYPETYSFVAGSRCYFVFSEAMGHDVSQIPGGWGIYRLDYTLNGNEIASAELSTVYALDEDTQVTDMTLSGDGKTILLQTRNDSGYCLTVIDLATMETLQELVLWDASEETAGYPIVKIQDDYILVFDEPKLFVCQRLPDGTYEQRIDIDIDSGGDAMRMSFYNSCNIAFDGERLAVVDQLFRTHTGLDYLATYPVCGFTLYVFDSTGLLYQGEYGTSLEPVVPLGQDPQLSIYDITVNPNYNAPFALRWE